MEKESKEKPNSNVIRDLEKKVISLVISFGPESISEFGLSEDLFSFYKGAFTVIEKNKNLGKDELFIKLKSLGFELDHDLVESGTSFGKEYAAIYVNSLKEKVAIREAKKALDRGVKDNDIREVVLTLDKVRETIASNSSLDKLDEVLSIKGVFEETINRVENPLSSYKFYVGYMDSKLYDFTSGNTVVIGARPSVGKTSFSLWSALNLAFSGVPVHFLSLEMSVWQIGAKIFSLITGLPSSVIFSKQTTEEEKNRMRFIESVFHWLPFKLTSISIPTIQYIEDIIRKSVKNYGTKVFFIDYVQLIINPKISSNRHQEVAYIVQKLKSLAIELDVAIVELSQLSRAGNKDPEMSHLKESGDIEQAASLIILLWKEEDKEQESEEEDKEDIFNPEDFEDIEDVSLIGRRIRRKSKINESRYKVINYRIEKHRNGPTFSGKFIFDSESSIFFDPGVDFKTNEDYLRKLIVFAHKKSPVGKAYYSVLQTIDKEKDGLVY